MKTNEKRVKATLSIILIFALITNFFIMPNIAWATKNQMPISTSGNGVQINKADATLIEQFNEQEIVTFLVKFKEQVDTNRVALEAAERAKKQKSAVNTEIYVRSSIVSTLRNTATETQDEVMDYLEDAKKKGEVRDIQSFYVVNAIAVTGTKEVMDKIAAYQEVEKILPNETRQLITPTSSMETTSVSDQSTVEWGVERVGAPQVWDMGIDGSGIVVASIDTGVQWDHPALIEKYRGYNPANPNQPDHQYNWFDAIGDKEAPYDDLKHGTHTVGTMVGSESDGSNQIGVAPGAKWIAVKAFGSGGGTDVDLLRAGEWLLAPKDSEGNPHPEMAPDVVNNSWGGGPGLNEWYRPMVENWRAAGIFPVFAAGNSGSAGEGSISSPANYPESLAVAATDHNNALAGFSSRGPGPYNDMKPDVSAPGVNIRSSVQTNEYGLMSGTSMATPHISGVIALIMQANASLTIDQIEEILLDTAIPLTDSAYTASPNYGYGHGFINAYNAIKSFQQGNGTIQGQVGQNGKDTSKPTFQHTPPNFVYDQLVLPLTVEVQDNIGVETVELQFLVDNEWKTIEATRTAGDFRNGTYQAVVPEEDVKNSKFSYKWIIVDYGKNNVISQYDVEVKPAVSIGYFQDFESGTEGWYSEGINNDWQWGSPLAGPGKAFSGKNVYGTYLNGPHAFNTYSYLNMPPVQIPESGNAYLQFKQWYDFSPDGIMGSTDFGAVLVSTDRVNWEMFARTEATGIDEYTTDEWIDAEVDLSAYAGKKIYICFYMNAFATDYELRLHDGWYVDDITLTDKPLGNVGEYMKQGTKKFIHTKKQSENSILAPSATHVEVDTNQPNLLPIGGKVTILESGFSTTTNPANGSFSMDYKAGDFTLRAEAYGFHSKDQRVSVPKDGIVESDFLLEPLGKGTVKGVIKDEKTGKPLADAIISIVEDAAITPVKTDSKGRFALTVYEGTYTLHVFKRDYVFSEQTVTLDSGKKTTQNIELKRFIGVNGEIGYDDGTSEDSWFFGSANNGFAIKMSLDKGITKSWLTGGLFKVNTEAPYRGTRFQVAVYDSTGVNGDPGKLIAGPFDADARTDGEWTHVDLMDKNIFVTGDFYLVYIQPDGYLDRKSPSLYSDISSTFHDRNWFFLNGVWEQNNNPFYGNMMIRAVVNNSLPVPVIESPLNNSFTKESKIVVKGKAKPSSTVIIQNNGKDKATGKSKKDGSFAIAVDLKKGENRLTAVTETMDGRTEPSEAVNIIFDQKKPEITIHKIEKIKGKNNEVMVFGKVKDDYLDSVFINNKQISVDSKGSFKEQIKLDKNEYKIVIHAKDKAGNSERKTIKIK